MDLPPGEPTVLELGTTRAVDPAEAEAWLRDPQRLSVAGCCDAVYLRKTTRGGSCGKSWKVLLEPDEVWAVGPQDAPQKQDLHRWKLRVLESSPPGQDEELVPADTALPKRGLAILSSSPWAKAGAGEGAPPASPGPPASSSHGWEPGTTEPGSSGPSGGSLAAVGASALGELARFQPFGRGPQN